MYPTLLCSKHGPSECLGNIQELCFKHVYPDYHQWFEFDLCLNERYQSIGNGSALAEDCGKEIQNRRVSVIGIDIGSRSWTIGIVVWTCQGLH